jgi:hypothetical protein
LSRPLLCPPLTRFTTRSLNSAVYACFDNFIFCLAKVTSILRHPWQTKFRGEAKSLFVNNLTCS